MAELCLKPCLWVGDHLDWCKPQRNPTSEPSLFTWVPQDSEIVKVIKILGHTLVYRKGTVSFASPAYSLSDKVPSNTVLLAQTVQDPGAPLRLLVFDVMVHGGLSLQGTTAAERYQRLLAMQEVSSDKISIQWCGNYEAMDTAFFSTLPHKVAGILCMGSDPLETKVESVFH